MKKPLTRSDQESHLGVIWDALHQYREVWLTEGGQDIFVNYDEAWGDICTAMAWIREDLGLTDEVTQAGDQSCK